jgi:Ras-related protein Rab-6A
MTENSMDTSYQMSRQKIIFTGDSGVGKTSIINSIMGQKFSPEYEPSIGVDFFSKTLRYKGRLIKLQIWDSAGQEKFRSLIPNYIRGSSLIFLIFAINNKESFEHLNEWINFITNIENGNIVIVGNKIDLKDSREITKEEAEKFCQEKKYDYFEVSAKEGTNINSLLFTSAASLPIFKALNIEDVSKENIIESLLQENLDSFSYKNNTNSNINTTEASENNVNNTDNNKGNLPDLNGNNIEANNNGLLSNQKKRRNICGC